MSEKEEEKQTKIREIYRDNKLTNEEKSKKVFDILNENRTESKKIIESKQKIECTHYNGLQCEVECIICLEFYPCRHCHNEIEIDHEFDRYNVEHMKCIKCETIQKPSNKCEKCEINMSESYCDICHVWTEKEIEHCNKCKICRIVGTKINKETGIEEKEENIHCDKCGICMKKDHECTDDYLLTKCPICLKDFFENFGGIFKGNCGHQMHLHCLNEYLNSDYRCPTCHKSLGNMSENWQILTDILSHEEELPAPFSLWKSEIQCVDCECKSVVKFHYQYHQCPECKGYNTQKLGIQKNE